MRKKKLVVASLFLSLCFGLRDFPIDHSTNKEEKISHAFVGEESASMLSGLHDKNTSFLFLTPYYQSYYFSNLKTNFGNNTFGTCAYISLGMLFPFMTPIMMMT